MSMDMEQKVESLDLAEVELRRPPRPPLEGVDKLKPERVQELLKAYPAWRLLPDGDALGRRWDFPAGFVAASYAAFVAGFAHRQGVRVSLECTGGQLSITLRGPDRNGGLTEKVLDFVQALG
jgi:hypothetical protein